MSADKSGLKSAWDLAAERLERQSGKAAPLTPEQKKALAEVDSRARAKIAETEIMMQQRLAETRAGGDAEKLQQVEEQRRTDLDRIRRRAEADKERIRQGGCKGGAAWKNSRPSSRTTATPR